MADNEDAGPNPLFGAVTEGRSVDAVRSMVHSHPDWVRERDPHEWLPLPRALEANDADAGVVPCLVAAHPGSAREWTGPSSSSNSDDNNNRGWLPLHLACESGSDLVDLRCLVEAYPEAVREKGGSGDRGMYPLDCEIKSGGARIEAIQCLLNACPDAVERSHANGAHLLHWAVQSTGYGGPKLDVVQLLVERVPSWVREVDEEGRLPIHRIHQLTPVERPSGVHAAAPGRDEGRYTGQGAGVDLVEFLVESGPEALHATSNDGSLPLHWAVRNRLAVDAIRFLVWRLPESVRAKTHKGDLPLHEAAVRHLDAVPVLLEQWPESGLEPAANGWPALHLAMQASPPGPELLRAVREMMRQCPASIRIATPEGFLPLHVAAKRAFQGRRVARAATEADAELVRYLAEQAPEAVRAASRDGSIPLHHAVQRISHPNHSLPAVRTFLELWPESVLVGDRDGSTAVHLAVSHKTPTLDMIRLLLRGEDQAQVLLAATDRNGSTPLHVAVARSDASWELVQYLVEHRPEAARCKDKKGLVPLHVAALNDAHVDVLYLLARKDPEAVYEAMPAAADGLLPPPCSRPCRRPRLE